MGGISIYPWNQSLLWDRWTKAFELMYRTSLSKVLNKDDANVWPPLGTSSPLTLSMTSLAFFAFLFFKSTFHFLHSRNPMTTIAAIVIDVIAFVLSLLAHLRCHGQCCLSTNLWSIGFFLPHELLVEKLGTHILLLLVFIFGQLQGNNQDLVVVW